MTDEQTGEILRAIDGLKRDVAEARSYGKQALDQLKTMNGQVSRHDQWIAIRTDREEQSEDSRSNRSSWFKVGVSTIVLGGVAMIGLLIQIATSVH